MVKQSKRNKKKIFIKKYLLWAVVLVIVAIQVFTLFQLNIYKNNFSDIDKRYLSELISTSETEQYKYPPVDVAENRVYIPEVRSFMPLSDTSRNIRYDFFGMKDLEMLYLSYERIVGHQSDYHTSANCDKIVAITKNRDDLGDFTYVGSIPPLEFGLQHVYKRNPCNFYTEELTNKLVDTALSLRSY